MIESWDDLFQFFYYLFQLFVLMIIVAVCGIVFFGIGSVIVGILFPAQPVQPYKFDYPAPLDVCPQTHVNSVIRDNIINVDYINVRGDTIYLVYHAQRGDVAVFDSQQVLDGDDCPQ